MIPRTIESYIEKDLFQGKAIIVYGARRVGKTTLSKHIIEKLPYKSEYFNCEELQIREILSQNDSKRMLTFFGDYQLIILDEAQVIPHIGQRIKLLVDTKHELQIIATGSSSFDLANQVGEPLVGRMFTHILYPLSVQEIKAYKNPLYVQSQLQQLMIYGSYPSTIDQSSQQIVRQLSNIVTNDFYKDIFAFENLKKPQILDNLTKLLAINLGKELSYNWLAQRLNTSIQTVENYLNLLEKTFIIEKLTTLNRNLSKEISRGFKIYFTDLGVRNYMINNFNPLEIRDDVGALWENFCIMERKKKNDNQPQFSNRYFWRTYDQKEIDYVEEQSGTMHAFEFKWGQKKPKLPKEFAQAYPNHTFQVISPENWYEFLF